MTDATDEPNAQAIASARHGGTAAATSEPPAEAPLSEFASFDAQWAPFDLDVDGQETRAFGPLSVQLTRGASDWRVEFRRNGVVSSSGLKPTPSGDTLRFTAGETGRALAVTPMLLDRSVVARPAVPVYVLPGETVRLFVATPLALRLETADGRKRLTETATVRLSDTWFGPSTREGELCYASMTGAHTSADSIPGSWVRAITAVRVTNRGSANVRIERVKIPCTFLSVFRDEGNHLWTEELRLVRTKDGDGAEPELARVPETVGLLRRVAAPRHSPERTLWERSVGAMLA